MKKNWIELKGKESVPMPEEAQNQNNFNFFYNFSYILFVFLKNTLIFDSVLTCLLLYFHQLF